MHVCNTREVVALFSQCFLFASDLTLHYGGKGKQRMAVSSHPFVAFMLQPHIQPVPAAMNVVFGPRHPARHPAGRGALSCAGRGH